MWYPPSRYGKASIFNPFDDCEFHTIIGAAYSNPRLFAFPPLNRTTSLLSISPPPAWPSRAQYFWSMTRCFGSSSCTQYLCPDSVRKLGQLVLPEPFESPAWFFEWQHESGSDVGLSVARHENRSCGFPKKYRGCWQCWAWLLLGGSCWDLCRFAPRYLLFLSSFPRCLLAGKRLSWLCIKDNSLLAQPLLQLLHARTFLFFIPQLGLLGRFHLHLQMFIRACFESCNSFRSRVALFMFESIIFCVDFLLFLIEVFFRFSSLGWWLRRTRGLLLFDDGQLDAHEYIEFMIISLEVLHFSRFLIILEILDE